MRVRAALLLLLVSLATRTISVQAMRYKNGSFAFGMGRGGMGPKKKRLERVDLIVSLNGEPKSGTSWLEMVAVNIAQMACDPEAPPEQNNECNFVPRGRNFRIYWKNGRVALFQRGGSCVTHKVKMGRCVTSKHNMFPICADESNTGLHHPANVAQGCLEGDVTKVEGCPCWLHPPPLNGGKEDVAAYRKALEACAASVYQPGRACEASTLPRDESAHGVEERFLLIARDPRDVAISEHFYVHGEKQQKRKLATNLKRRVPIIGSWVALRYYLAEYFNAASAVHRKRKAAELEPQGQQSEMPGGADDGRTHPPPDPYLVVLYNSLRTSLEPYRKICRLLDFKHCSDDMLRKAKDSKSAASLKELKEDALKRKNSTGASDEQKFTQEETLLWRSKLRSAGKKDLGSYGLPDDLLKYMADYTSQVLPEQLAADLKAGSVDWITHKLKTENDVTREDN